MALRRSTHVTLAALAAVFVLVGVYGIMRVAGGSAGPGPQGSATGDPAESTGSAGSSGSSGREDSSGGGKGGTGSGPKGSGTARISGPTVDNVFPEHQSVNGRYRSDACFVLANNRAGIPIRIRSYSVRGAQARISDQPCDITAANSAWNADQGVTDPIHACSAGTLLEPKSQSPRHACSIHFARPAGLGVAAATLYVEVTADCTPSSPSPCPSSASPVTAIITSAIGFEFAADSSVSGGDTGDTTSSPPPGGDTGEPSGTPSTASTSGDAGAGESAGGSLGGNESQ